MASLIFDYDGTLHKSLLIYAPAFRLLRLASNSERTGYATEAVKAFLPEILKQLDLQGIEGACLAENTASIKVMENCEFSMQYKGIGHYQGNEAIICGFTYCL